MTTNSGAPSAYDGPGDRRAARPIVRGQSGVVSAGHYLAAAAGYEILREGGNAVDAGVAAGLVTNVVHHDYTSFGGVAPIILYSASDESVHTISGLGRWPKAASLEHFRETHGGTFPQGILRSVVPAAPDAWITALLEHGSLSFGEVAQAAIRFAREGYPMYEFQRENLRHAREQYEAYPDTAEIFLPQGRLPEVGDIVVQEDLAGTLERLADAESAAGDRESGLRAAREYFYEGPIAEEIAAFSEAEGGFMRASDLAEFSVGTEDPVRVHYGGFDVYTCGPWCQGPVLAQALKILERFDLREMGHNSAEYLHTVLEALKLAFADREWYYGDPDFVDVPIDELVSDGYTERRARRIDRDRAHTELPPPGETAGGSPDVFDLEHLEADPADSSLFRQDTSYIAAMDDAGNTFSATPSDGCGGTPLVPGLGIPLSTRGRQSRLDPRHPARLEPRKRPRLTPSPALVMKDGEPFMAIGTPGGDVQPQAMLQVLLNRIEFGMNPQEATEAPRVATYSFPSSWSPNRYYPGVSAGEDRIPDAVFDRLTERGHRMQRWQRLHRAGGVNTVVRDPETGLMEAGADPRRESYAVGE